MSRKPQSQPVNDPLAALPLFAQALLATRLARRASLAMLLNRDHELAIALCDQLELIARDGDGWRADLPAFKAVERLKRTPQTSAALDATRWAFDATGAAQAASDVPVDDTVTFSLRKCEWVIKQDPRISALQLDILIASDADQLAFACSEIKLDRYAGLTHHVLSRLAPCHALTLNAPRVNPEDLYR
jgi:hypothetical protein